MSIVRAGYRPVTISEKSMHKVVIQLAKQYRPQNVIREYVTNSLDALDDLDDASPGQKHEIDVLVVPDQYRLVISDTGMGMSWDELDSRRDKIGESYKINRRGEKGLGLLCFASIGQRVHVLSRQFRSPSPQYGYLSMENKEDTQIMSDFSVVDGAKMQKLFHGPFDHGTRVIVDGIEPTIMDRLYTPQFLRGFLSELYTPALDREANPVNITLSRLRKNISREHINALDFNGEVLLDTTIDLGTSRDDEEGRRLSLDVVLLFNQESEGERVRVYSKDVLVYPSITDLVDFAKSKFWTSGKLTGYINDRFSKLQLGRDGIDVNTREFRAWYSAVKQEVETKFADIVESRIRTGPKRQEDNLIKRVWDAIAGAYKLNPMFQSTLYVKAGVHGVGKRVTGASPVDETQTERKPESLDRGLRERQERPELVGKVGGTFVASEFGREEKVSTKQRRAIGVPIGMPFPIEEAHLRSKFVEGLAPLILINDTHPNYLERKKMEDRIAYIADMIGKEIGFAEAREDISRRLVSEEEAVRKALLRAEDLKYNALRQLRVV